MPRLHNMTSADRRRICWQNRQGNLLRHLASPGSSLGFQQSQQIAQ
jgi:hypothetical protein